VRRFLARRLAHGAAVIFIAASLSFLLVHLAPGDPFSTTLDSASISPSVKEAWRSAYGLDRPRFRNLRSSSPARGKPSRCCGLGPRGAADAVRTRSLTWNGAGAELRIQDHSLGRGGRRAPARVTSRGLSAPSSHVARVLAAVLLCFAYRSAFFPTAGVVDPRMHDSLSRRGAC
jgi:hypothetical protein